MRLDGFTLSGTRVGRGIRIGTAATVSVVLSVAVLPAAMAERGNNRAYPTQDQVSSAKARVEQKARDVASIKASLLMANQQLEQAALHAEQASEAYNKAMWQLQLAAAKVHQTRREATRARRTVERQRTAIGGLVATSYQQGTQLTALGAVMGANGPEGVLDQYAAFQGASTSLQADYQRYAATDALARVFERKAEQARKARVRLAGEARTARQQATTAAAQAQAAASQISAEKDRLIQELAQAQHISVALARQRQTALEEIARQRAAAQARRQAEAAARAQARAVAAANARAAAQAQAAADAKAAADARAASQAKTAKEKAAAKAKAAADAKAAAEAKAAANARRRAQSHPAPAPAPAPAPEPAPAPTPPPVFTPPSTVGSGGAAQAIAFAKAQLGDPYVWGAAGPDSWDCSGLTMAAWGSAGVYLPHYAAAQYSTGTPISAADLRPGDLVFWATTSSPSSIHHVAMYIGNGLIIHAPRTGRSVEIDSMYYWIPPNFFARV